LAKPVILIVDDEPQVLSAVERDLRRHYRGDYRIVRAGSGQEALEATRQLKLREEPLALMVADQRMPGMTGTEFLVEAKRLYPDARKVLLTAYADTEAAIASINAIGLDYYLQKPWDPPEQRLYPVLDDLIGRWTASTSPKFDGIRVAGAQWSPSSHRVKDFLSRNRIPYKWLDNERDDSARALVEGVSKDGARIPVVFFPDGTALIEPESRELAVKLGLLTQASQPLYDVVIIGGGPAGLAAAVYGSSEGMKIAMVEREATGGQAGMSSMIENYLGFPKGVSGADLAERATIQARRFGTEILTGVEVKGIRIEDPYRIVLLSDGSEVTTKAVMIATGMTVRKLNVPGIERLTGAGVFYGAAVTEALNYRAKPVMVIGGANSAGQGAVFLARFASKVTLVVRRAWLDQSKYLRDQIAATPNLEVRFKSEVAEALGTGRLEAAVLKNTETGALETAPASAMFVFIGAVPHSEFVAGLVERTPEGFIVTGQDLFAEGKHPRTWTAKRDPFLLETSVPGVFAAGDVRFGTISRIASAVGQGGMVISFAEEYLKTV
jgi:thioredoxin reductase (NADPH)